MKVKIVCIAGLPKSSAMVLQMFGRVWRQMDSYGLAILFIDPWVHELAFSDFNGDIDDLDRPAGILKTTSSAYDRAPFSFVALVQTVLCLRLFFSTYLNDLSAQGL